MEKRLPPVIIDTDPGIDDAAAIFWVLASGKFDVKALTIANGNIALDGCATTARRAREGAGRVEIPGNRGADRPIAHRPIMQPPMDATWVHGQDGRGDAGLPMPTAKEAPG